MKQPDLWKHILTELENLGPKRLLTSEKSGTYKIKWSYTIIYYLILQIPALSLCVGYRGPREYSQAWELTNPILTSAFYNSINLSYFSEHGRYFWVSWIIWRDWNSKKKCSQDETSLAVSVIQPTHNI